MKREITAVVGLAIVLPALYLGGPFATVLILIAGALAQFELYKMFEAGGVKPLKSVGILLGVLSALHGVTQFDPLVILILGFILVALVELFRLEEYPMFNIGATMLGVIYPALMLSYLIDLRLGIGLPIMTNPEMQGFWLVLCVFLMVAATDTFAYYTGKNFGTRKLLERISPKKTWEGSMGGVLGAVVIGILMKFTVLQFLDWADVVVMMLICGILSQFGDLVESMMKRSVNVKDSGTLLPGHGGFLDRLDALLFALPMVYTYLAYIAPQF